MADNEWLLNEDGYLNIDSDIKEIIYHPPLNVIIICTSSGIVRVLDVNSGVILQSSYLSGTPQNLSHHLPLKLTRHSLNFQQSTTMR